MFELLDIELSRLYRETIKKVNERMAREQVGEAFQFLTNSSNSVRIITNVEVHPK